MNGRENNKRIRRAGSRAERTPFEEHEIDLGEPGRGEVLVRIVASGVCHTDAITRAGDMGMPFPAVLGHEGAGVVETVGEGVSQVAAGDRVILGWPSCGECRNCLDGQPRYCLRTGEALVSGRRFKGELRGTSAYSRNGQPLNGHFFGQSSFGTYSIASADALVKVSPDVPLDLLGPLACGIGTGAGAVLNEARPGLGDSVLIVGVGAVGLAAIMAARNSGVTKILAADVHDSRLKLAEEFGATHTINSRATDIVEGVRRITGSRRLAFTARELFSDRDTGRDGWHARHAGVDRRAARRSAVFTRSPLDAVG